jgi:hypothetical protein
MGLVLELEPEFLKITFLWKKRILEPGLTASCRPSDPAPKPVLSDFQNWNQNLNFTSKNWTRTRPDIDLGLHGTGTGTI